jgi:hypothetical protein
LISFVQQRVLKKTAEVGTEEKKPMMIVGQVSSATEADEIELITRNFIVARRIKELAQTVSDE